MFSVLAAARNGVGALKHKLRASVRDILEAAATNSDLGSAHADNQAGDFALALTPSPGARCEYLPKTSITCPCDRSYLQPQGMYLR